MTSRPVGPDAESDLFAGRYRLGEPIGDGQRKRVVKATDVRLGRDVAVALVRWAALTAAERARVERELEIVAQLSAGAHVVTLYDAIEVDGELALVFEHLVGGSVGDLLDTLGGRGLPIRDVLRIGRDAARGLDAAHRIGVTVRDVKPDNILLTGDGVAKLADFGLAIRQGADRRLTDHGGTVGTFTYLAPERIRRGHYDHRVDLYSLGVTLYEMVAGEPPFPSDDPDEVAAQHLNAEPPPLAERRDDVPSELTELIHALLGKAIGDRPADAATVAMALERCARSLADDGGT